MTTVSKPVRLQGDVKEGVKFPFIKKYFSPRVTKLCNMSQLFKALFNWARTFTQERWFSLV